MFRIGEFSKLVRVSARMLRYYAKCGLFRPAETDRYTGYRLYSAAQIPLLSRIVELRDMGFGIEEIEETLPRFNDADYMRAALESKQHQISETIAVEQAKLDRIAVAIKKESAGMIYEVEMKNLPAVRVISLRETIPVYSAEYMLWEKLGKFMACEEIVCENGYSIYHDDEYKESDVDVEIAVPVDRFGENRDGFVYRELEGIPLAATIRFSGPYDNYTPTMEKLAAWVEQNGYEFIGNVRGFSVSGGGDPVNQMTELQVGVRKA